MKTSKLLITSLLAAATMSVPAWAEDVSGDVAVSAGNSTVYAMTGDTTFTFTNNPTLTGSISGAYTLTTSGDAKLATGFGGTDDTRWTAGNLVVGSGTLTWGQGDTNPATANQMKALGETISVSSGAALKIHLWTQTKLTTSTTDKVAVTSKIILNGTSTLETGDGSYYFSGGIQVGDGTNAGTGTFTANWRKGHVIGSLSGAGTFTINEQAGNDDRAAIFSIAGDGGFSGTVNFNYESGDSSAGAELHLLTENALKNATVNLTSAVDGKTATLSLDAATVNIKGLTGTSAGRVVSATAGNTLAIATQTGVTNTFSGTVGTSTSAVGLSVSGSGAQAFTGTSYFSTVSVADTATLNLGGTTTIFGETTVSGGTLDLSDGTITLASAIQNSGLVTVSGTTVFNLTDSLKTAEGVYTLISGSGTISGALTESNFTYYGVGLDTVRSSSLEATESSVAVTLSVADLTWAGTPKNSTWDVKTTQNWTNNGASDAFYTGDNVTFSGDATVTVADGGVTAGTVNITAGTVTLSGGKVTAVNGFFVGDGVSENDSIAKLVLSSNNALCGDVTVNKGGTFDLNAQSDSMSSDTINPNRVGKIVLNGGSLTSEGGTQGTGACQIYNLEVTADSKIIGTGTFGILGRGFAVTTLNLGANTLTKSGEGSFVLVNTTISGNGGVLDVTDGKILGRSDTNLRLGEGVTLKTSGTGGAQDVKIASMAANSKLILGGSTASTVVLDSFALGAGAVIDVSGAKAVTGTITSMAEGSALKLAGTGAASTVTLTGDIAGSATLNIANGSVTWTHNGTNRSTSASISIGAGSTFKDNANFKYSLELSGALSGAGTLVSGVPTSTGQGDGFRTVTLSGSTADFTGEWQLETAYSGNSSGNRRIEGVLNSSDGKFGGVVSFTVLPGTETNIVSDTKTSSKLSLGKDMEIGGLKGTLSNTIVGSNNTETRALTINVKEGAEYIYAGKIDSTISGITKKGAGTQTLSGTTSVGDLSVTDGTLALSGTANIAGTTTVTGGTLDLSGGNITLASTIQNSGTVAVNSETTFDISIPALRSMKNADGSVSVISGGNISDWNTLTTDSFTFNGAEFAEGSLGRYSGFAVGSAGEITFTATAANLVWSNASGDGLWNTTSGNWTNGATTGDTFVSYDSVEFNTDAAVTVDSAGVTADLVTISAGTVSFSGGTISATQLAGSGTVQLNSLPGLSLTGTNKFENWTGRVVLKSINTGSAGTAINPNDYGATGSTVVFDGVTGDSFYFHQGTSNALTIAPNIEIGDGGLTLNNGYSSTVYTFAGDITGSGNWNFGKSGVTQQYTFIGDVSNYSGTLSCSAGTLTLTFENSTKDIATAMKINASGGSLTKKGSNTLEFNQDSSLTLNTVTVNAGTLNINGAATLGTLNVTGGTVNLGGTATGTTTLAANAGTVNIGSGWALSSSAQIGGVVNIGDGGVWEVVGQNNEHSRITGTVNINAGGMLRIAGHDALGYDNNGAMTNATIVAQGKEGNLAKIVIADTSSMTFGQKFQLKGYTEISSDPTVSGTNLNTFSGSVVATGTNNTISSKIKLRKAFTVEVTNQGDELLISGSLEDHNEGDKSLLKTGTGTLTLTGTNTYTGGTTVEAGTLVAAKASALGTGPVTVNGGSVLKVAVNGGLDTDAGTVTFNEGAKFAIDLTTYDVALGTALSIITASAISFNGARDFSSLLVEETFFDLERSDLGGFSSWAREWNYENGTLSLVLTVPEPSVFGLLAGLGALALAGTRRRRKKA